MERLKVGIIGCGRVAKVYKEVFKKCSDRVEVRYTVDKEYDRAQLFAKDFEGCDYSDNFNDVLKQDLDVVHICTPHFLHKHQAIECLNAGFNVIVEKPMAINMKDADEIIEVAHKSGRKFSVIFQNRYIEGIQEAKKIVEAGKIGNIIGAWSLLTWCRPPSYYKCDWKGSWEKEGGGVLIDQAIHSIDLVQYLVDSPVAWIDGHIANRVLKSVEVEDVADAAIGFKNGCIYSLFATNYYKQNAPVQIEIMGDKGKINLKGFDVSIEIEGYSYEIKAVPLMDINEKVKDYWGTYHFKQLTEYYDAVIYDKPVFITGEEGRKALEIVLGIYQSAKEGKKVNF